jgi:L-fuculose-phosphate aldolase
VSLSAEVVTVAQEMLRLGLVVGTAGNVSVRDGNTVLITPAAVSYDEITPDDLATLPPGSSARDPSSEWRVHQAIYDARPDVGAVVHTHSIHATAWSCLGEPLDTQVKEFGQVIGGAIVTAQDAPPGSDELAANAAAALGDRNAALLYRHGVLALGDSPGRALVVAQVVERHAQMAWLLRGGQ